MKTLIVEENGTLSIREIPRPKYNDNQALVKMVSCGICNGTDAKIIHQKFKGIEKDQYPLMLGHEGVGRVVEVGKNVTGYKVGDVVLLPFVDPDEDQYGKLGSAWGAYSEYGVINDAAAYTEGAPECAYAQTLVPPQIDPVDAAVIITLREVLSSIKRFGIRENQSVAVFGCGPVGLTFIKFLKILGVHPIIAFDIIEEKLEEAKQKGADYAFNSKRCNPEEEIRKICPNGVQYVLDAVGVLSLINMAMECICDQGKICCYGISRDCHVDLDWSKAPYNWQLQFQQFPSKKEEGEADRQILSWIQAGILDLKDYISDYFAFEDILEAFEKLEERKIAKKGIIVYEQKE